jgi:hypothetical protein
LRNILLLFFDNKSILALHISNELNQIVKMESKKIILLLSFAFMSIIAESQIPPPPPPPPPAAASNISSKADSLINEGNIKAAVAEYKRLVSANPGKNAIIYNYACVLSLDQQTDSAFRYLYLAEEKEPTARAFTDPDLINLREDSRWKDFEDYNIKLINLRTGNSIKDEAYARQLWKMLCLDQYSFYETSLAARKLGPDSPVVSALRKLQNIKNENNLRELEALLSEKGWPKRSQVGPEASSAAFFILQHSNAKAQEKYIAMFEKCCRENEADWRQYALLFDRMRMNQNLPQRYGTHARLDNRQTGRSVLYPLEDEARVDEWRREIGLEPLKEYLIKANIEYVPSTEK